METKVFMIIIRHLIGIFTSHSTRQKVSFLQMCPDVCSAASSCHDSRQSSQLANSCIFLLLDFVGFFVLVQSVHMNDRNCACRLCRWFS